MRSARDPLLVLAAVLLVTVYVPAPDAGYVREDSFRYFPVESDQSFYGVDFQDEGEPALLVGGALRQDPRRDDQLVVRYGNGSWDTVFDRDRTILGPVLDVGWRPGHDDYALMPAAGGRDDSGELHGSILACVDPCRNASHVRELWRPSVTRLAEGGFSGRQVAWHPGGDHALVTGSGLIRWNGTTFATVERGEESFYNAVEWHPSGEFALVQRNLDRVHVCWDPCRNATDLEPLGWAFGEGAGTPSITSIAFHPLWDQGHDRAYVLGLDGRRSHMVVVNITDRSDPSAWTTATYNPIETTEDGETRDKRGELTDMAWARNGSKALVTSSLSKQVTTFPRHPTSTNDFDVLMDLDGPKLHSVDRHPGAAGYALMGGDGGFYRYDHDGVPVVTVETPDPDRSPSFATDFRVDGHADPKRDGEDIRSIEWTIVEQARSFARIQEDDWTTVPRGNWSRAEDGRVTWSFSVEASTMQPGDYVVGVRADDGEVRGPPALTTFTVPGPEVAIDRPGDGARVEGRVTANGTATPRVDDGEVTGVEWRVDPGPGPGDPEDGSWHGANATHRDDGSAAWSLTWNASRTRPCRNTLEVRALEGNITGLPSHRTVYVPGCLDDPPDLSVEAVDHRNGTVSLSWSGPGAVSSYSLQVADDETFFENRTLASVGGSTTSYVHAADGPGTYHYRVKATNAYEESPWGTARATLEEPSESGGNGTDGSTGGDGSGGDDGNDGHDIIGGGDGSGDETGGGSSGSDGSGSGAGPVDDPDATPTAGLAALVLAGLAAAGVRRRTRR